MMKMMKINLRILKITLTGFLTTCFFMIAFLGISTSSAGWMCAERGTSGFTTSANPKFLSYGVSLPELTQRKYTMTELFGNKSYSYALPYSQRNQDGWVMAKNNTVKQEISSLGGTLTPEAEKRLVELDTSIFDCTFMGITPAFNNFFKGMNVTISNIVKWLISLYFDNRWICDGSTTTGCVDLIGIAGGDGNTKKGIIGKLTTGIYFPFLSLAFLFVAMRMAYTGIIKREFRKSWGNLLWAIFALFIGISYLHNPLWLAKIPKDTTNIISYCIVEAFNGNNCMADSIVTPLPEKTNACTAYSKKSGLGLSEKMVLFSEETNCNIEKTLVIDNWSRDMFGYAFDDLYITNPPEGHSPYSGTLVGEANNYCVNMYSENKLGRDFSFTSGGGEGQVCNIALALMASRTKGGYDPVTSLVIGTGAENEHIWYSLKGDSRDSVGFLSFLSMIIIAISFIPVSVFANIFSLQAMLLIIFAPIFFLFMIEPEKGKRIFLGWLESLISAVLKFAMSGFLLIVMITIYSEILSSLSGGSAFIVTLLFCMAFLAYRKQILELVGTVNMGGKRLSNKLGEKLTEKAKKAKDLSKVTVGGAIGGAIAAKRQGHKITKGLMRGTGTGLSQELAKGNSFVSKVAKSNRILNNRYKAENREEEREVREDIRNTQKINAINQSSQTIRKSVQQQTRSINSQTQAINSQTQAVNLTNTQQAISKYLSKVNTVGSQLKNDLFKTQIKNASDELKSAQSVQTAEYKGETAETMIEIARGIENYSASNHGNEEKALELYIKNFEREQNMILNTEISKLESLMNEGYVKPNGEVYSKEDFERDSSTLRNNFDVGMNKVKAEFTPQNVVKEMTSKPKSLPNLSEVTNNSEPIKNTESNLLPKMNPTNTSTIKITEVLEKKKDKKAKPVKKIENIDLERLSNSVNNFKKMNRTMARETLKGYSSGAKNENN